MSEKLRPLIGKAAEGPLTRAEAETAFSAIMSGDATPAQIGGFLMALRARGETVDEYAAAAAVMRAKATMIAGGEAAMDIVGTGGDGKGTLNISTAAAFVVAGAGVPVAKHGNRALSSRSGASDALGELGVNVMVEAPVAEAALAACGVCFMMAPMHHPAMRFVGPARFSGYRAASPTISATSRTGRRGSSTFSFPAVSSATCRRSSSGLRRTRAVAGPAERRAPSPICCRAGRTAPPLPRRG